MTDEAPVRSGGVLALMGLDTAANACATFLWTLPHLALCVGGLALMSWLLEHFLSPGIPLGGYVAATALAGVMVFFTLALMRGAALRGEDGGEPDGSGTDDEADSV